MSSSYVLEPQDINFTNVMGSPQLLQFLIRDNGRLEDINVMYLRILFACYGHSSKSFIFIPNILSENSKHVL